MANFNLNSKRLNSSIVRLKEKEIQEEIETKIGLNSSIVRLKALITPSI